MMPSDTNTRKRLVTGIEFRKPRTTMRCPQCELELFDSDTLMVIEWKASRGRTGTDQYCPICGLRWLRGKIEETRKEEKEDGNDAWMWGWSIRLEKHLSEAETWLKTNLPELTARLLMHDD